MAKLSLRGVSKRFGQVEVIRDLSLEISSGEFAVFLGPSGCGKSTLLRMVAGLEAPSAGEIYLGETRIDTVRPGDRGVAMVFQHYALYPHMTVRQNMAFGLRNIGTPADEIARKVDEAAASLEIAALLDRKPGQLSGGQRQRVAIGRAIVKQPKAFLFDEPLSNLDAALRGRTRIELARLHQRMNATMVFVTHDQVEAMTMATRIVVMNQGRIEQVGTPMEVYQQPSTRFVAGFVGTPAMNFLSVSRIAEREGRAVACLPDGTEIVTQVPINRLPSGDLTLGIRAENIVPGHGEHIAPGHGEQIVPEHVAHIVPGGAKPDVPASARTVTPGHADSIMSQGGTEARVVVIERLGERTLIYADLRDGSTVVYDEPGDVRLAIGETVRLTFDGAAAHLFGPDGIAIRG